MKQPKNDPEEDKSDYWAEKDQQEFDDNVNSYFDNIDYGN